MLKKQGVITEERWRNVQGYNGLYIVSNTGKVASIRKRYNKCPLELKQHKNRGGYMTVRLYKDRKIYHVLVHRLVAFAFCKNPHNYNIVNHKDENTTNNASSNLEWCTAKYNINYGTANERRKITFQKNKHNHKQYKVAVNQYDINGNFIKEYQSTIDAAIDNNLNQGCISLCCKGICQMYGGYIWRYKMNNNIPIKLSKNRQWQIKTNYYKGHSTEAKA